VIKLYGSYTFGGTELAANFYGGSGTPSAHAWTINGIQIFVNGRGDMGRTKAPTQTDMLLCA
jgi:hypothetical protein